MVDSPIRWMIGRELLLSMIILGNISRMVRIADYM